MSLGLLSLPPEVLDDVVGHFDSARTLISFLTSCQQLKKYVEQHGYRAFVRANFPSYDQPLCWDAAARSLTGLVRCWERRALLARLVEQETVVNVVTLSNPGADPPHGRASQSMGCRTVLQCREHWNGGDWRSRIEALYIGAGAELHLRLRSMGPEVERSYTETPVNDRAHHFNHFGQHVRWTVLRDEEHKEGKCDITSVLPLPNEGSGEDHTVVITRYCGKLEKVTLGGKEPRKTLLYSSPYALRFADISPSTRRPLVLASNSLHGIRLFDPSASGEPDTSLDLLYFTSETPFSLVWASRFLDATRVVVGKESNNSPLGVYQLTPAGFHHEAVWEYTGSPGSFKCVKALAPLRHPSSPEEYKPDLFLSGWLSNVVLLHDVRAPGGSPVSSFSDPIDQTSQTYSILPFGADKFIAGSDRHGLIRFFDMRMTGGRCYSYLDTAERRIKQETSSKAGGASADQPPSISTHAKPGRGFNVFVRDSQTHSWGMIRNGENGRRTRQHLRLNESPIYDLAASSPYAASFYAGLVGASLQVDLVSSTDRHPDVAFSPSLTPDHTTHSRQWLDPKNKALRLGLVEHVEKIELFTQVPLGPAPVAQPTRPDTIDPRWRSGSAQIFLRHGPRRGRY